MALIDTMKALYGSAWHVQHDAIMAAQFQAVDGTAEASKPLVLDSGLKFTGVLSGTFGAGTATVNPITLTAGTNLTTAAAGAFEYDGKVLYFTSAASSRQAVDTPQFCVLTTNFTMSDSASAQKC